MIYPHLQQINILWLILKIQYRLKNLQVNGTKTDQYKIKHHGTNHCKRCKLLGSPLDTDKDMLRWKLSLCSIDKLNQIFYSQKLNVSIKSSVFNWHFASLFLSISQLWTLAKSKEDFLHCFYCRLLLH